MTVSISLFEVPALTATYSRASAFFSANPTHSSTKQFTLIFPVSSYCILYCIVLYYIRHCILYCIVLYCIVRMGCTCVMLVNTNKDLVLRKRRSHFKCSSRIHISNCNRLQNNQIIHKLQKKNTKNKLQSVTQKTNKLNTSKRTTPVQVHLACLNVNVLSKDTSFLLFKVDRFGLIKTSL